MPGAADSGAPIKVDAVSKTAAEHDNSELVMMDGEHAGRTDKQILDHYHGRNARWLRKECVKLDQDSSGAQCSVPTVAAQGAPRALSAQGIKCPVKESWC